MERRNFCKSLPGIALGIRRNMERRNFCKSLPGIALGIGGIAGGTRALELK